MTVFLPIAPEGGDDWLDEAACAELDINDFFVQAGHVISEKVLDTCRSCPVRLDCLKHAYNPKLNITGGYFAGMSPGQRRELTYDQAVEYCKEDTLDKRLVDSRSAPVFDVDENDAEPIVYS